MEIKELMRSLIDICIFEFLKAVFMELVVLLIYQISCIFYIYINSNAFIVKI